MEKIINYLAILGLVFVVGEGYINNPVASQSILGYEPLRYENIPNTGTTSGGDGSKTTGNRGDCPPTNKYFTALIPQNNGINTLAEYPTLWFYSPYKQFTLNLVIEDKDSNNTVVNETYEINQGEGIVGVTLPEDALGLEVNRTYNWRVYLTCDPLVEASAAAASGVIQRVTTDEYLITHSSIKERIRLYAKQGLWAEAITTLIEARKFNPADEELQQNWSDLLSDSDVLLEDFVSEPLVE
ncbi:MAG: DUF928 domain-containing protein [Spirulinaceae cyanobacterium]